MRLSTQFKIIFAVFSIVIIVIGIFILINSEQIRQTRIQESLANNALQGASELTHLSNQYVIYRESSVLSRWQATYATFSNEIGNITVDNPDQQGLLQEIKFYQQNMKTVFDSIVTSLGTSLSPNPDPNALANVLQNSWSRISISSQIIISDSTRLSQLLRSEVDQLNLINFLLIFTALAIFSVFIGAIYFQTFRRTLKSIYELQASTKIIGSGNLDHKIKSSRKDEIGELSHEFNQMTTNLKTVTASKTELEKEVSERKKAEDALRQTQAKLQEYTQNLELLVEERTTQLRQAERLATIGQTAGMVGHDIRNPLQSIIGDLYLLKSDIEEITDEECKQSALETIEGINDNLSYINKIIADLQDYARQKAPRIQEIEIKEVIDKTFSTINVPENIQANYYVEPHAKLKADPAYIRRIITNLTINAIQAMPQGGKLTIEATCQNEGETLQIIIADTGGGIPKEIQEKLFTPLFTTKSKGQGFGLAVVKKFIEELGGAISFESQLGKGTKFIVELPSK